MSTNSERQAAFKARMRERGKRQLTLWVTAQQERTIKAIIADGRSVTASPSASQPDLEPAGPLPVTPAAGERRQNPIAPVRELATKAIIVVDDSSVADSPSANRLDCEPAGPLPVTPATDVPRQDPTAPVREAMASGLSPRFKKTVVPAYGEGWSIFVGPHPVGRVWKAKSGHGWEGVQTLRASLHDALYPRKARTRQLVTRAVLDSLEL